MDIYMFSKPAYSDATWKMALKRIKKSPLKEFILSVYWKLVKTLFDRHKNNMATGADYLTL